jgi:transcriptional regulator with XRE-family HTH domain
MIIGERIRTFRQAKRLSQQEMEDRTGLLRCYLSRVENGHTIPSIPTLEKFARALEIPVYQLFHDSEEPPALPELSGKGSAKEILWGSSGKDAHYLAKFRRYLSLMKEDDRQVLLSVAERISANTRRASIRDAKKQPAQTSPEKD